MKNTKSILIFFILLTLLFWNPVSFYLFYHSNDIYDSGLLKAVFWIIPVCGVVLILVLRKKSFSNLFQNLLFSASFFGVLFGLFVVFDSILGLFSGAGRPSGNQTQPGEKKGLIFEPNVVAHSKTVEFDYKAVINSIGLRNREISVKKEDGTYRILCFGDSWTFGLGVNIENSYPMQLEKYLHSQGYSNVEVVNCGKIGEYTTTYKKYMSKAVPLLKPDLVIVGLLQVDDLAQLYENNYFLEKFRSAQKTTTQLTFKQLVKAFLKESFVNFINLFTTVEIKKEIDVTGNWADIANNLIKGFNYYQQLRYSFLLDTVRTLLTTGNLDYGQLNYYINYPDRLSIFNDPKHPATLYAIEEMNKDIEEMKTICTDNGAELIVVNMPIDIYTGHKLIRTYSDFLPGYYLKNNHVDSIYRSVAENHKLEYIQLTERFIELEDKEAYFFLFDGHPNAKGYSEIAKCIGNDLIKSTLKKE